MPPGSVAHLRALAVAGAGWLADAAGRIELAALQGGSCLETPLAHLRGRSVLIAASRPLAAALAAIELDGVARRMVLLPPGTEAGALRAIAAAAEIDAVVGDGARALPGLLHVGCGVQPHPVCGGSAQDMVTGNDGKGEDSEWVLCTSGSTGSPKLVVHSLASLLPKAAGGRVVWSTFYDIRRYGGLAILLRAVQGGGLLLAEPAEPVAGFVDRAMIAGVTHLTGTPSHWRRALMCPGLGALALEYVRLSGEVADQPILDRLRSAFPAARVVHAFASTEAGLAFEVDDGAAGFAADLVGGGTAGVELRVQAGTLRVRSDRAAQRYLAGPALRDAEGFVDTGDVVERVGDRCFFAGRREGVINVGGEKIYPEEVEAVIGRHPLVRGCRVWGRPSPLLGSIVAADVMLDRARGLDFAAASAEILSACRGALPPHKVPARLREVASLEMSASGKLRRSHA